MDATRLGLAAALCVWVVGLPAFAQDRPTPRPEALPPLGLEEVLASVVRHYPLLEAARLDRQAAAATVLAERGGFDPEVRARATEIPVGPFEYTRIDTTVVQPTPVWGASLFGGWRYGAGAIPLYYGNLETNGLGELRAGATVPLWRNREIDRRRAQLARAHLGELAAEQSVAQTRLESTLAATRRYWDWVAAGQRRDIARRLLEISETRARQVARRVRQGDLPAFENAENERVLLQRRGQVTAAERNLQQAALELSLFLRNDEGQPLRPSPARLPADLPEPVTVGAITPEVEPEVVLDRRPDVQRLAFERGQRRLDLQLARNQQAPQVDVSVAAIKDLGPGSAKLGKPELELGLVLDIPTLNRAATGRARAARHQMDKLQAQLQLQRERALIQVRDAALALEAARERLGLARREVAVSRELEKGEMTRFRMGETSLLFVNLREQATAEAMVREVDIRLEALKAAAELRVALGQSPAPAAGDER